MSCKKYQYGAIYCSTGTVRCTVAGPEHAQRSSPFPFCTPSVKTIGHFKMSTGTSHSQVRVHGHRSFWTQLPIFYMPSGRFFTLCQHSTWPSVNSAYITTLLYNYQRLPIKNTRWHVNYLLTKLLYYIDRFLFILASIYAYYIFLKYRSIPMASFI